ncbi:MAG: hypothetical protein ABSH48_12970 [Verrucomicrobiota bacterium]|jgi:hypothetical protein
MPDAVPIIYSFFGVGSGSLGASPFNHAGFVITIFTNTGSIYTNPNLYPTPMLQNTCPQATATIAIAGLQSAVIGFGLTITALNNTHSNLFQLSAGVAPDVLCGVASPALSGYGLDTTIGPVFGTGSVSQQPYPTTAGNLLFLSASVAGFQATLVALAKVMPPGGLHVISPGGAAAS